MKDVGDCKGCMCVSSRGKRLVMQGHVCRLCNVYTFGMNVSDYGPLSFPQSFGI